MTNNKQIQNSKYQIPKVIFRFSEVYNQEWRYIFDSKKREMKYPSDDVIRKYIDKVEKLWKRVEQKMLTELTDLTGLKWDEREVICYVVGWVTPFADPLTLPVYKDDLGYNHDYFVDILTHELIHRLQTQDSNRYKMKKYWAYADKKYAKETFESMAHISVNAIHAHLIKEIFDDQRLEFNIRLMKDLPDYKSAWEIVLKEGYKSIIKEFKANLK